MSSDRNAAIWYSRDGYDPSSAGKSGLNGRRVAGASFLKGFFRHADVEEFVSLSRGPKGAETFRSELEKHDQSTPHRAVFENNLRKLAPVGTLYFPAPNYAELLWKRQAFGVHNHSICGITHTTATQAVMRGMFDLRAGPQMEWDGVICTSRAVHAATLRNMEIAEEALQVRFGALPPRPQMPVIPLGINCDDFAHDPKARAQLRKRMNWGDKDVAVVTISRLLPYGKFDPGPLFIALQAAQERLGKKARLHVIACGLFADTHSETVFNGCAKALMPDVGFHHLPGDDATARKETLSGGDIFTFPIDNVQETFGLAPIEAMAAGLPLVVSDWDGMKDTVTEDVGFRVPTRFASGDATRPEAEGYLSGSLTYPQYGNRLSMITDVSVKHLTEAFVTLAKSPATRKRMGSAARERALSVYDWSVVIPQMQEFWSELTQIRQASIAAKASFNTSNPVAPRPGDLFASYASAQLDPRDCRVVFTGSLERLEMIFTERRYANLGNPAEGLDTLRKVSTALAEQPDGATCADLAKSARLNVLTVERCVLFFLKYDLAAVV